MPNLDWFGKKEILTADLDEKIHLLERDDNLSCGESDNLIIHGDNMPVMKSLLKDYRSRVKCIYIDPPYNTGAAFETYDDNFEHSQWLSFMYPRLRLLKEFLTEDGAIFISIDDNEQAYLKVICDEIFGRDNFVATIIWERAYAAVNLKKHFSESHDYIICYAKNFPKLICNGLPRSAAADKRYKNPDNDPRGVWTSADLSVGPVVKSKVYEITTPGGRKVLPPSGYCWRLDKERFEEFVADNRIYFGVDGNNVPRIKRFLSEVKQGMTPMTIWKYEDVGHSQDATKELKEIFNGEAVFTYPKPVKLIQRCLELYSDKNSIILDAFAGSGTTAHAVINLNQQDGGNRKFILIESADYCSTVTAERVKRVGGSFNYLNLGVNLYTVTKEINPLITYDQLAKRIWRRLTKTFLKSPIDPPLIGIFNNTAIYLFLDTLSFRNLSKFNFDGEKIIFAESCLIGSDELKEQKITFKHLPRFI